MIATNTIIIPKKPNTIPPSAIHLPATFSRCTCIKPPIPAIIANALNNGNTNPNTPNTSDTKHHSEWCTSLPTLCGAPLDSGGNGIWWRGWIELLEEWASGIQKRKKSIYLNITFQYLLTLNISTTIYPLDTTSTFNFLPFQAVKLQFSKPLDTGHLRTEFIYLPAP